MVHSDRARIFFVIGLLSLVLLSGCFQHIHTVGSGPHTGEIVQEHQWYILWGLVAVGDDHDGGKIADNKNCRIITEAKALDCLINFFTGVVSVYRTTVTVEK